MARLRLALTVAATLGVASIARAANEDGVPLSADAAVAGMTIGSHDGATGAWYNPAALGGLQRSSIQGSTSLYTIGFRSINDYIHTNLPWQTRSDSLSATDFTSIPSSISYVLRISPRVSASLGVFSPVREYSSFDSQITSTSPNGDTFKETIAVTQRIDALNVGPAIGWGVTDTFRVGLGAFFVQNTNESVTDYSFSVTQNATPANTLFLGEVHRQLTSVFGARGVLGLQWDVAPWLTLSVAVRSPLLAFASSGHSVTTIYAGLGPVPSDPNSVGVYGQTIQDASAPLLAAPARLTWSADVRIRAVRLAFEGDVRHPIDDASCGGSGLPLCTSGADKWVANARIGAIVQVGKNFWVGAGAFTDMGGWDLQKSGRSIDFFGGTAGIQFRSPAVVKLRGSTDGWDLRTTLAVRYGFGYGEIQSALLNLNQAFTIGQDPQPGTLVFHELSANVATMLEF